MSTADLQDRLSLIEAKVDQLLQATVIGEYITEDTLRKITGLGYQTIYRLRKDGVLKDRPLGRTRFYNVKEIKAHLERSEDPPDKK